MNKSSAGHMQDHIQPLLKKYISREYDRGHTVLFQGEAPRAACVVESGIVRAINISTQGDEQTINFHVAGEFFPNTWIFDKTPTSIYFYEAVTPAKISFIPRDELIDSFSATPKGRELLLDYLATNYTASLLMISALGRSKASEKLILILYYLCERYGEKKGKSVHIGLQLTHQHLASLVGLTRETTATELNKLKRLGVLDYHNQHYTVDVQKLLRLIGEDSFLDMHLT